MDLVDEEDVALVELVKHGGQVAGPLEGRAGGDVDGDAHLGGDDAGQGGLAQTGRTGEQQVVDGLAAPAGRLEDDRQVLLQLGLADELVERARAAGSTSARDLGDVVVGLASGRAAPPSSARHRRAMRQALEGVAEQAAGVAVVGQVGQHLADLVVGVAEAGEGVAHVGPAPTDRPRRGRDRGQRRRVAEVGDDEPGLELDEQAGGGLLADPGHQAQGAEVVVGQDAGQRERRVDRQDRQGQRGPDAVRAEQRLEADALVLGGEAVERLRRPRGWWWWTWTEDLVADIAERRPRWWG